MNLKSYQNYCKKKKGVEETTPFGPGCSVMKVGGKMFALTNTEPMTIMGKTEAPFHHISVKCDPDMGAELRRNFDDIIPGWHLNKTHWISLLMNGKLEDKLIKSLIDNAYDLVVSKLPKKDRVGLS